MKKGWFLILVLSVSIFFGVFVFAALPDGFLKVVFLDVGQGDAALVFTPGGKKVLIDGGVHNSSLEKIGSELSYFSNYIDLVVATHGDKDHMEGLIEVLRRYEVGAVLVPPSFKDFDIYEQFFDEAIKRDVPILFAENENDFVLEDGVFLDVIWPKGEVVYFNEGQNEQSLVLKLVYGDSEVLFAGDVTQDEEKIILAEGFDVEADILKVAHHGSKSSTSLGFLNAVDPTFAVVSVGENNFGHPDESVLERIYKKEAEIFRTDENGDVKFVSDGLRWKSYETSFF